MINGVTPATLRKRSSKRHIYHLQYTALLICLATHNFLQMMFASQRMLEELKTTGARTEEIDQPHICRLSVKPAVIL